MGRWHLSRACGARRMSPRFLISSCLGLQAANDPRRKGILVPLGQDCSTDLLRPVPGLPASAIHRNGQQVLVWRPHVDFPTCLPDGIKCPCCKANTLAQHEASTRNVRKVMARDRTIFMIGCVYKCKACAGGCPLHSRVAAHKSATGSSSSSP